MQTLRLATTADLDRLAELDFAADTGAWLGEIGRSWHEKTLADPDTEHLVTEDPGPGGGARLTGYAVLANLTGDDRVVELRRIVVHPAARGTGHGRALLRAAVDRAYARHRAGRVWLDVKVRNLRARGLYESEGFVATETLVGAMPEPDGSTSDLIVMVHQAS